MTDFNKQHIQNVTKDNFSLIPGESMADESQSVARAPGNGVSVPLYRGRRAEMASSPFLPNLAGNGITTVGGTRYLLLEFWPNSADGEFHEDSYETKSWQSFLTHNHQSKDFLHFRFPEQTGNL